MSPKIKYHKKEAILSVRFGKEKSVDSDIQGNVVVDYDKKGNVVSMDIMNINLDNFVSLKDQKKLAIKTKQAA